MPLYNQKGEQILSPASAARATGMTDRWIRMMMTEEKVRSSLEGGKRFVVVSSLRERLIEMRGKREEIVAKNGGYGEEGRKVLRKRREDRYWEEKMKKFLENEIVD